MAFDKSRALTTADKHIESGDFKRAAVQLNQVCRSDPDDIRTRLRLGELYQKLGRLEVSLRTFVQVADAYVDQGHLLKAVAVYNKMLSIDSGLHTVHLALARAYKQLGLVNDAASQYKEVIRILSARARHDERLCVIEEMIELDPHNVAARVRLGEEYIAQGRIDDARNQLKDAAATLEEADRTDECIRVLERLVFYDADDLAIRLRLAGLYMGRDDVHMALPHLRACFHEKKDNPAALDLLAEFFAQMGQENKASAVLRALAHTHHNNRLLDERDAVLERLLEINPNDIEARAVLEKQSKTSPEMAAEIVFDDLDIDEIFLGEDRVEVLAEEEGPAFEPPPLPSHGGQDEELTTVEKDPAYQSGELPVSPAPVDVVVGLDDEHDDLGEELVADEEEVEHTPVLEESGEDFVDALLSVDPTEGIEYDVALLSEDESEPVLELDTDHSTLDGAAVGDMPVDELDTESLEVEVSIDEAIAAEDPEPVEASRTPDVDLEAIVDVADEDIPITSTETTPAIQGAGDDDVESDSLVAEADDVSSVELEVSEPDPSDDVLSVEDGEEEPAAVETSAPLVVDDHSAEPEKEVSELAVEDEPLEEVSELAVEDEPLKEVVEPLDSEASEWDEWDQLDAQIQDVPDDDAEPDSENKPAQSAHSRLAVPIVTVDWDGPEDVLDMESDMVSLDALLAEEEGADDVVSSRYGGIHRVAVPIEVGQSVSTMTEQTSAPFDDDDWVVEVLVDEDSAMSSVDSVDDPSSMSDELSAELNEFDFFFTNGFHAEAAAVLDEMESSFGRHPEVLRRREALHQFDL